MRSTPVIKELMTKTTRIRINIKLPNIVHPNSEVAHLDKQHSQQSEN
jgi:hypothetical protein